MGVEDSSVLFRVDSDERIGFGHLSRCLNLAAGLQEAGRSTGFLVRSTPETILRLIEREGHPVGRVEAKDELEGVLPFIRDHDQQILVTDGHQDDFHNIRFQKDVQNRGAHLVMITVRIEGQFLCDLLHNQNPLATGARFSLPRTTRTLLGLDYAVLDPDFLRMRPSETWVRDEVGRVLVTMGGVDRTDQTNKVLQALSNLRDSPTVDFVVGSLYPHKDSLQARLETSGLDGRIHVQTKEMAALMAKADLAVCSGGLSVWELACLGVPTVVVSTTENERKTADHLARDEAVWHAGHREAVNSKSLTSLLEGVIRDSGDRFLRSGKGMALLDGKGRDRVVMAITGTLQDEVDA